jgi:hypothetical protein
VARTPWQTQTGMMFRQLVVELGGVELTFGAAAMLEALS